MQVATSIQVSQANSSNSTQVKQEPGIESSGSNQTQVWIYRFVLIIYYNFIISHLKFFLYLQSTSSSTSSTSTSGQTVLANVQLPNGQVGQLIAAPTQVWGNALNLSGLTGT